MFKKVEDVKSRRNSRWQHQAALAGLFEQTGKKYEPGLKSFLEFVRFHISFLSPVLLDFFLLFFCLFVFFLSAHYWKKAQRKIAMSGHPVVI